MARGDHIFVERIGGLYSHHGIDCGDGSVIHFTGPDILRTCVQRGSIEFFAGDGLIRVYEQEEGLDASAPSLPARVRALLNAVVGGDLGGEVDCSPEAIVARAEGRLGERGYDPVLNNCEHFASWCRTGISRSRQVDVLSWPFGDLFSLDDGPLAAVAGWA